MNILYRGKQNELKFHYGCILCTGSKKKKKKKKEKIKHLLDQKERDLWLWLQSLQTTCNARSHVGGQLQGSDLRAAVCTLFRVSSLKMSELIMKGYGIEM